MKLTNEGNVMSILIKLEEISSLFELIIKKLQKENIEDIEIEEYLYWFINSDNWNVDKENPEIEVGSFKDDWEGLLKCIDRNEIVTYVEFDRLASILKVMSNKLAPIS